MSLPAQTAGDLFVSFSTIITDNTVHMK